MKAAKATQEGEGLRRQGTEYQNKKEHETALASQFSTHMESAM